MRFKYIGKNILGEQVEDFEEGSSQEVVLNMLRERGVKIDSFFSVREESGGLLKSFNSIFEKASLKDTVNFSRQMSALLEANVPILKAFQIISQDTKKEFLQKTYESVIDDIKGGKSISQAISKHPKVFNDFYINMIRSGEESGRTSRSFSFLADYLDRSYALTMKVRNAMIYPSFVVATFLIVMILIFTMVIPKLAIILKESNVALPLLTRIVLTISDFLVAYGLYILLFTGVMGVFFWLRFKDSNTVAEYIDDIKMKVPLVKNVFKMMYVTRIADNLQTLLSSNVSLPKSIKITSDVVGNKNYKIILDQSLEDIKSGIPFSECLGKYPDLIPSTMVQMLKIGEETGETSKLLENIARFYQREINNTIDTLIGLIEPMMIVSLGIGVGLLLVSVLMPIYNLAGAF